MKKNNIKDERAKKIGKLIIMVYGSLESHITWTYKEYHRESYKADNKFHEKCIKEYAEMIKILSELF